MFAHSGRVMGGVRLGPGAALCRSSNFLCWPSPDSEKCWAGWSYTALEQRTLSKHLHINCTVRGPLRPLYVLYVPHFNPPNQMYSAVQMQHFLCCVSENKYAFWIMACNFYYHGKKKFKTQTGVHWNCKTGHIKHILYVHTRYFKLQIYGNKTSFS